MKRIYTILLALLLGFISGCSMLKARKFVHGGTINRTAFKVEVPFEMHFGLIVLKVMIHGKEYSFLFDSGAPCVITKELAQQLGIISACNGKISDSQGNNGSLGFTAVDSMGIGGIQFFGMGAAIADLRHTPELACFNLDGLVGANLMRTAVWQIDYQRSIITITNSRDSLSIPATAQTIKFRPTNLGEPLIDIQYNGQIEHNATVDLGSNGDFYSSAKTFEALKKDGLHTNTYTYGFGETTGLYGRGKEDTTWYAVISSIGLDNVKLSNQVVSFRKNGAVTVGTNFFKHDRLILDWSSNELTMIPVSTYDNTIDKRYGFTPLLKDRQVLVGSVFHTSDVPVDGPQVGDRIIEVDGIDYHDCSPENYCTLLSRRYEDANTTTSITVKRGDKELKFSMEKKLLFPKK